MDSKLVSRERAAELVKKIKAQGKSVGFTSGAFDILHRGHVEYLERAKEACDYLVVGVNSDSSVRQYKGQDRPIVGEMDRAYIVASLQCVDCVFIFSERRNRANIEILRPNLYIKAGDYKEEDLTSKPIVERHGGKVLIIPFAKGYSTTGIINKIQSQYISACKETPLPYLPAIFLDRDGTINEEIPYLHEPAKFRLLPGAIEGLKRFSELGYRIVIVTNQPGIGFGYYTKEDFFSVNTELLKAVSPVGIKIHKIYYCPHTKADECECRKPKPAMLLRAKEELNLNLEKSFMIGDSTGDILAGKKAGCKTILVLTGKAGKDGLYHVTPDITAKDLKQASEYISDATKLPFSS